MHEVILTLAFALLFVYLIYKLDFFKLEGLSKRTIAGLYIVKLIAGVALALVYTYYYTNTQACDLYKYFQDGETIYQELFKSPLNYLKIIFGINTDSKPIMDVLETTSHWFKPNSSAFYNDNRTIIRFNAVVRIFSFGSIGVHTTFICFLSFTGLTALYKVCTRFFYNKKKELLFAIYLIPSVTFWGSGLLKEGILLFALGWFLYFYFNLINGRFNIKSIIGILLFSILFLLSKVYVLIALMPPVIAYLIVEKTGHQYVLVKHAIIYLVLFGVLANLHHINASFNVFEIASKKQFEFVNMAIAWKAGSYYEIPILEPNSTSFISIIPLGIFNSLFRPGFNDISSPIILFSAIENILLLGIILFCLFFFKPQSDHLNFACFCIGFALILFGIVGTTTPIIGALVRYRIPGLPFLLIFFLLFYNKNKAIKKFPILKFLKS